jgi:hypothetical protein
MSWKICLMGTAVCCCICIASAQAPAPNQMTFDEFRHYLDVLHVKETDERGARASMKAQDAQVPPWWPSAISDEMLRRELQVDFAGINYSYVKSCLSSPNVDALTAMFATPEGQQYLSKMMGNIVEKEGDGISATAAREAELDHDTGLPAGALQRLSAEQRARVKQMIAGGAMDCMNSGFKKASIDIADARAKAAHPATSK